MSKDLKNVASVSLTTVLSRVTGLLRDVLIFAALGASAWSSAFIVGFTIPNLFRRLFGEGALSSAFIPVFSTVIEKKNVQLALAFFSHFIVRWTFLLTGLAIALFILVQLFLSIDTFSERWVLSFKIFQWLLPYMIFICLAAIFSGALNSLGRFFSASFAPVLFNLVLILAVLIGIFRGTDESGIIVWLCGGVLLGGLLQLLLPLIDLKNQGWTLSRTNKAVEFSESFQSFQSLFFPSLLGAAVLQINILVSRLLANTLDDTAVSFLYVSSRMMELPLGVFAIAVVTVFFPVLSRTFESSTLDSFANVILKGLRFILIIVLPAAVGLSVLSKEILIVLFEWGSFGLSDVRATVPILIIYSIALPFYSITTYAVRCFYAGKNMKLPVRLSIYFLILNTVFSLLFMNIWGVYGLALANLLSAILHTVFILRAMKKSYWISFNKGLKEIILPIFIGLLVILIISLLGKGVVSYLDYTHKIDAFISVFTLIPLSVFGYFLVLHFFKISDLSFIKFSKTDNKMHD